jgi:hypothetical protein
VIARALLQWSWLVAVRLLAIIVGLFLVAVALPFRRLGRSVSDGRPIINLPGWAWLWDNAHDGMLGDKRLWWAQNTPFGWPVDSYLAMWWWAAIRNPANNMRLLAMFSAPVDGAKIRYRGDYTVEDKPGFDGWQLCWSEMDGRRWFGFYLVHCWSLDRAFVIRLGFKVKPEHSGRTDEPRKGLTFKVNPFKKI